MMQPPKRHIHVKPPELPEPGPWYDGAEHKPHTYGWYECKMYWTSARVEMLYWNGRRWLRGMCNGRYVMHVKQWRGLSQPVDPAPWGRYVLHPDDSATGNVRRLLWDFKLMNTKFNIILASQLHDPRDTDIHLTPEMFRQQKGPRRRPRLRCEPQFDRYVVEPIIGDNVFTDAGQTPPDGGIG